MKQTIAILIAGAFIASVVYATDATVVAQDATKSVNAGVYSSGQAQRGAALYKDQCAACHGDDLAGSGPMPPLAGSDFVASWNGKTLGDLFDKIHSSMPASSPGSLTEQQTSDIIAYMLSVGKFPAGATDLEAKMEPLQQIKIEPPSAGGAQASPAAGASAQAGAGAAAAQATAGAPPQAPGGANNVAAGVYTAAQADRGKELYSMQCSACHADDLSGGGSFPPLAGADFVANWNGKTVGDLFDKIHSTMPASAPGSLTEQQTADLIAYMLSMSKYPAGMTELAAEMAPLQQITIVPAQ
jgi:mono/diheme cytochrome c family protein